VTTAELADYEIERSSTVPSLQPRPRRRRALALTGAGAAAAVFLAGCSVDPARGFLPGNDGTTNLTEMITNLWVGAWVAALAIGLLVWGLLIWCIIVYRKRKNDNTLPVQLRYHLPLELLYTFVPLVMVGVLFYFTVETQNEITDTSQEADVHIQVYGKQWSWDFNYLDEQVWDAGVEAKLDGTMAPADDLPTLYLPVGKRVEFTLDSRDVIHSFWVPAFLYKIDVFPYMTNTFQVVPEEEGTYLGKCAELCGELHGYMLFNVKVVSEEEYDAHIQKLRDLGQTGELDESYDRAVTSQYADATTEEN